MSVRLGKSICPYLGCSGLSSLEALTYLVLRRVFSISGNVEKGVMRDLS